MLTVRFGGRSQGSLRILCLGAHSDDIEIGCGGTILRLLEENPDTDVLWVVLAAMGLRGAEARDSASFFLANARQKEIVIKEFRDGFFPYMGAEIKTFFEYLKQSWSPDVIFTHYRHDLHQDHRLISELTWNTFRDHLILEYEIIKYDGDIGTPNFLVHLSDTTCELKVRNLLNCYKSQREKSWFTEDAFLSIMRLRGLESNAPHKYAEGYYCRKAVY